MTNSLSDNYNITRKVTLVGSVVDALLSVLKIAVGTIGQSQALIADGFHSLSDLATDVLNANFLDSDTVLLTSLFWVMVNFGKHISNRYQIDPSIAGGKILCPNKKQAKSRHSLA